MSSSPANVTLERLSSLREQLGDWGVEAVLIGSATNRRWLSGFSGSAGWLLVSASRALIATDFRYWDISSAQAPDFELVKTRGGTDTELEPLLAEVGPVRLGIEARQLTVDQYDRLARNFDGKLVKLRHTVEPLREAKSSEELQLIRKAAAITDQVMAQVPKLARAGMTERELAWQLERAMREAGATSLAFDIIVASGPNSALPHHQTGERQLSAGDAIIVDMGAEYKGYKSDLTRTFFLGEAPDPQFSEVFGVVEEALQQAVASVRPGMDGPQADRLGRQVIEGAGYGDAFGHGLGHGVGLDIHEDPRMSPAAPDHVIQVGNVVTVEPGIYLPGWGGVRLEELALITPVGAELISRCHRQPLIP
jgi:Xaa-Pro aminopeptidase